MNAEEETPADPMGTSPAPARGLRLGPMVWVPEFGIRGPGDPWAHRKGEPRIFALCWCIYLMLAALLTLFSVRSLGMASAEQFRYGAHSMLVIAAVGVALLWPAVRLSQAAPERPTRSGLIDLAILLAPLQAVVWPLPILTRWPWDVIAALAAMYAVWAFAISGIITIALCRPTHWNRMTAYATCVIISVGPAVIGAWRGPIDPLTQPPLWRLLSPFTAPSALVWSTGGLMPRMELLEWGALGVPILFGLPCWALTLVRRPPVG